MKSLREISIQYIKGVGPARARLFKNLGIETVEDLLYLFPRRYEDRTQMTPIAMLKLGETQTVSGKVVGKASRRSWYTRKHVSEAVIDDGSGRLFAVWFNQPYLERYFKPGLRVVLYGKTEVYKKRLQMISPEYEIITEQDAGLNTGRIVPIYPLTRGITQRYLRKVVRASLDKCRDDLQDILPVPVRNKCRLPNIRRSIENIHFPESPALQEEAIKRISFEEFFLFQLSVIKRRMAIVSKPGIEHEIDLALVQEYGKAFPFSLTPAQKRVIAEIAADMQKPAPMLRLLQGDVGSGKTLVAFFGCVAACRSGHQAAVMAPTAILARQHYQAAQEMFGRGPFRGLRMACLVSALKPREREDILARLLKGDINLLIGTHALLEEEVKFKKLSFVVIDEQHKFGVRQRALLSTKGTNPDVLVMTATPIPRTLSLTLFGDLDVSVIDEMPPGRGKVETRLFTSEQAGEVYRTVREMAEKGRQAYVVYPIIEESEKLDLKAAQAMYRHFLENEFKGLNVGLLHGQLSREQTEEVMGKFRKGEIQILVATTVLEVGVDVPRASIMVVEHAERFGLSQLHQLRGRIGRGRDDGQCLLIADPVTEDAQARLKAVLATTDGFKIAQEDLLIRGPGHYFGRHQHGLNELKFANPVAQIDILELARKEALELTHADPELASPANGVLKDVIVKRYPNYLDMIGAG
ncbi:MAG: ATP-dependent DNA helicase RecG [Candidatus Omnitrophota bacterium]|nr:ATP-dependent DNA helicase RecG [Candidatus Omnitrophota bacterium]MDZ4241833.1 ATP-dependent DNA helicase RecG [Candidatus Omnitrophota bacterium]